MTQMTTTLAAILQNAAMLHQESYDHEKAKVIQANMQKYRAHFTKAYVQGTSKTVPFLTGIVDYRALYTRTVDECAAQACEELAQPQLQQLVSSMLHHMKGDALNWAARMLPCLPTDAPLLN